MPSSCIILLFVISSDSFALFRSPSCLMMVLRQESSAVFSNSLSGSESGIFEDLWRMALLGMTWLRTLADPAASGVKPDIGCGCGSDLDKLGS